MACRGMIGRVFASNQTARVRFSAVSGILVSILGLIVCPFSGGGLHILLTTDSGRPALELLSSV